MINIKGCFFVFVFKKRCLEETLEPLKGDASECGSMSHQAPRGTLSEVVGEATTASGIRGSQACGQKWEPLWAHWPWDVSLPLPPGVPFLRAS